MGDSKNFFQTVTQVMLPAFTIVGFALTSLKMPEWGLLFTLIAQVFWIYASWQAWKKANQIGIFITTLVTALIVTAGVINYWVL